MLGFRGALSPCLEADGAIEAQGGLASPDAFVGFFPSPERAACFPGSIEGTQMNRAKLFGLTVVGLCLLVSCGKVDEKTQRQRDALKDLKSDEVSVRVDAVNRIGGMIATGNDGGYVSRLVGALDDDEAQVRAAAIGVLSGLGDKADPGLKKLRKLAVDDPSAEVRSLALVGTDQLAPGKDATLALLKSALDDEDLSVALQAASVLTAEPKKIAPYARPVANVIKKAIKDAASSAAGLALAQALAEAGEGAKDAVPVFQTIVEDAGTAAPVGQAVKIAIDVINGKATSADLAAAIMGAGAGAPMP